MLNGTFRQELAVVAIVLLTTACATSHPTADAPLTIQQQGSFAVGGTVVSTPGTFDPIRQGAYSPTPDPAGQTVHGDHAYVFYQGAGERAASPARLLARARADRKNVGDDARWP